MSTISILFLIGAGVMAYIAVQTLKQSEMKIASDFDSPGAASKRLDQEEADSFNKVMERVDHAFEEEKYHDAEAALETALGMRPDNEEVLGKMAYVLEKHGDFEAATAVYVRALEIHTHSAELFASYASMLKSQGKLEASKENYINAVQLQPKNPLIYYNFSNLLAELGEIEAAKEGYQHALDLDKNFKEAREALSALSMKKLDTPS